MILRLMLLVLFIGIPLCVRAEDTNPQNNKGYVAGNPPADEAASAPAKDRLPTLKEFLHSPKTLPNPIKCLEGLNDWTEKNLW